MSLNIDPQLVVKTTLKVGIIYKFEAPELIDTDVPHHFIVIALEEEDSYLAVCTSQLENKTAYLRKRGLNLDTLAYLPPSSSNGLKKDTYVDCNGYHTISREMLMEKISSNAFQITGELSEEEYNIILKSVNLSHLNDIPKFLLKYK